MQYGLGQNLYGGLGFKKVNLSNLTNEKHWMSASPFEKCRPDFFKVIYFMGGVFDRNAIFLIF